MHRANAVGFALYEVMLGLAIFAIGVIALGRSVNNCVTASGLSADEARVRQILANRMAEVQTTPGQPDAEKEIKVDTGHGIVRLLQKTQPEDLKEESAVAGNAGGSFLTPIIGISRVTLTAQWVRGGVQQSKQIAFYVYRPR
jgi:Tfp pilus assembly protein PilV